MRKWAVVSAAVAPVAPVLGWYLAQSRQPPGYDWVRQTISALAARGVHDRWIMTAGLALLGTCHLLTASGLTEVALPGRLLLGIGGAATLATAVMPQPATGHLIAAGIAFCALTLWPAFARVPGLAARLVATAVIIVLLIWFAVELHSGPLLGISERFLAVAQALWPLTVVIYLLSPVRRPVNGTGSPAAATPSLEKEQIRAIASEAVGTRADEHCQ